MLPPHVYIYYTCKLYCRFLFVLHIKESSCYSTLIDMKHCPVYAVIINVIVTVVSCG